MRVIVAVILVAVLGYAAYWVVASRAISGQIDQILAQSQSVAARDVELSGFPYRFDLRARDVAVTSADGQNGWRAPDLTVTALSYRPHHLIAFATGQQALTWRGVPILLDVDATRASLVLTAGTALDVARANLVIDAAVIQVAGGTYKADTLRAALRGNGTTLDLALEGLALTPDPALVAWLDPMGTLPPLLASIGLDAGLTLDAPLSLRGDRVTVQDIAVRALSLDWGPLMVSATGDLRADSPTTWAGQINLQVTGWPLLLDALARNGAIAPDMLGLARQMAASMADPVSGVLTLPLGVAGSRVSLGPIALGSLPRF